MIKEQHIKDIERVLRLFLVSLLTMTAMYKLSIGGDHFVNWYQPKFTDNPYGLSMDIIAPFMHVIAYIELLLAIGLVVEKTRNVTLYCYFLFLIILMFGHFALSEFHEVNGLFDYLFAGVLLYVLPRHPHLLWYKK